MRFYVGWHQPGDVHRFARCMVSVNRLRRLVRGDRFRPREWMLDSGAFTKVTKHGGYPELPEAYAAEVNRWKDRGQLAAAVSEDFMCEPFVLARTGGTVESHQAQTIARYRALVALCPSVYVLPVLQGYAPAEYARHVRDYGRLLPAGAWVGVGSVCKRNADPAAVREVLAAILAARPDLRLHGFGLKLTALADVSVRRMLWSADSAASSYNARRNGRNANDPAEAERYALRVERLGRAA